MYIATLNNNFSVKINYKRKNVNLYGEGEKRKINGGTYYVLPHKTKYSIELKNSSSSRCDAHVFIDGEEVGIWRVNSYSSINIDRPVYTNRQFTFYKKGTYQSKKAGMINDREDNGLIKVVFKPEKEYLLSRKSYVHRNDFLLEDDMYLENNLMSRNMNVNSNSTFNTLSYGKINQERNFSNCYNSTKNYTEGITGLSGRSNQEFGRATKLFDIDKEKIEVIYLRLIAENKEDIKPLKKSHYPQSISYINNTHSEYPSTNGWLNRTEGFEWLQDFKGTSVNCNVCDKDSYGYLRKELCCHYKPKHVLF